MVDNIKTVFQEYTRLRLNGLDTSEAVSTLRPYLQEFDKNTRDELARNMRAWENQRTEKISLIDHDKLAKAAEIRDTTDTMNCPKCGKSNIITDSICFSCGALLQPERANSTAILASESSDTYDDARFSKQDTLLLKPSNSDPLELRPQASIEQLLIGRSDPENPIDVDLEPYNASGAGVSRLHAALTYDDVSETLAIFDMGSTNGTYINGQLLHANERRTIRHGDELQFGQLKMRVAYKSK